MTPKELDKIVLHCTATPEGREVSRADIEKWHLKENKWSRLGYSDIIHLDGTLENLTDFNQNDIVENEEMTWGVKGQNSISRHIVYAGGLGRDMYPKDTRTLAQKQTMIIYLRFMILRHPNVQIAGHNQFANKACPSFDVRLWLTKNKFPEKNIYKPIK